MSWRTFVISNPAALSLKNEQLVIKQEIEQTFPVEDISVLILESLEATLTTQLLKKLAEFGVLLYQCDEKHFPCGIYTSFNSHSRQSKTVQIQIEQSTPFTKRCWQRITQKKIQNQGVCLKLNEKPRWEKIYNLYKSVQSGDVKNIEGLAAREYFSELFGDFNRRDDSVINASLNYGYAILRGAIARSIVSYGFMPCIGVHHRSELNNFNLADDFIEPFRPVVDLWTSKNIKLENEFDKEKRMELVKLLDVDMMIGDKKYTMLSCIDMVIESYVKACREKDPGALKLPELIDLEYHNYE